VVLPDPFREMGMWTNSTETKQSGHAPRSGPEVKNGNSAKYDAPERLSAEQTRKGEGLGSVEGSAGAARRILLPFYPA